MGMEVQQLKRDTMSRKKDISRQKVAFKRNRQRGLFIKKTEEHHLPICHVNCEREDDYQLGNTNFAHPNDMSYGSETLEPY